MRLTSVLVEFDVQLLACPVCFLLLTLMMSAFSDMRRASISDRKDTPRNLILVYRAAMLPVDEEVRHGNWKIINCIQPVPRISDVFW